MPKRELTDGMPFEECSFQITTANELILNALIKYSMMLDIVTGAQGEEQLNVDGLLNSLLNEGMNKRVKELVKRHGFEDVNDFTETLNACKDGDEALQEIKLHEQSMFQKMHDEILSHIPLDDGQKSLKFE